MREKMVKILSLALTFTLLFSQTLIDNHSGFLVEAEARTVQDETASAAVSDLPDTSKAGQVAALSRKDSGDGAEVSRNASSQDNTIAAASDSDYYYSDNSDGTVTIIDYHGSGGYLVIPSELDGKKVTRIGDDAFADFDGILNITGAEIPNTVTGIGKWAFYGTGLTDITIPESVATILTEAMSMTPKATGSRRRPADKRRGMSMIPKVP